MTHAEFFPYAVAPHAIALSVEPKHEAAAYVDGRLNLQGVPDSDEIKLELSAELAPTTISEVLPEAEQADPPVGMFVTVRGIPSRLRQSVPLAQDGDSWHGEATLPKADLFGMIDMAPALVRITG